MVNTCVVQGCIVCTAKQNVTCTNFRNSGQDAAYHGGVSSRRREATGSRRITPMCAVNTSFLLTLLTMSNTRRATQRNESSARLLYRQFFHQNCLIRNTQSADSEATYRSVRVLRLILLLLHTFSQCRWCSWWLVHVWF